jgi:hypothetical protein
MIFSRLPRDQIARTESELEKYRARETSLLSQLADANASVDCAR